MKKKNIQMLFSVVAVFALSFILALEVFAASVSVKRREQLKTNWCWVACAQMLAESQVETSVGQFAAVEHVKGSSDNVTGTAYDTQCAAEFIANDQISTMKGNPLTKEAVKRKIDNGYPVIMALKDVDGSAVGHMVVVFSYSTVGHLTLYYYDPAEDYTTKYSVSYDAVSDSNTGDNILSQGIKSRMYWSEYVSISE